MVKKFSIPRGTIDILPEEAALRQKIEGVFRTCLRAYGYKEIRTPAFEETALFIRSIGATTDVVQKQMLQLAAQGPDEDVPRLSGLSLRPEGTAAVARSYIEHSLDKQEQLSKFYYICPMFRGERPQKGRLRQFHQAGVEVMGPQSSSPYLDAEVITLSVRLLNLLGLENFRLKINSLGTKEDKENFSRILREKLAPRKQDLCQDCQSRLQRNVFRILDCKHKACRAIVKKLQISDSHLSPESRQYFQQVCRILDQLNIRYEHVPSMVRGLDYYTHTVFEISDESLGSQDALGAGGRYNSLIRDLGGPEIDAVGFALGIERIILALPEDRKRATPETADVFLVALNESCRDKAVEILYALRHAGIASDMSYRRASVKSLMRQADKSGARFVMILGEDELAKDVVTLKDMIQGEQKEVPCSEIEQAVRQYILQKKG